MNLPTPDNWPKPDNWTLIDRALLKRCPRCGKGRLYKSYLKQVSSCGECHEDLGHIRADDGPAWLTVLLVGHIILPLAFLVELEGWSDGKIVVFWCVVAVLLTLMVLPRAKALFIGIIWRTGCGGSEKK